MRQKSTGYQKDQETQLDFAEARMYENRHARFTAVDPLLASGKSADPQTFNRYVYVMNSPLAFTDPTGLIRDWVHANGQTIFDSRVTDQESATNLYGEGARHLGNDYRYTSSSGNDIHLLAGGNFTKNGVAGSVTDQALVSWYSSHQGGYVRDLYRPFFMEFGQAQNDIAEGTSKGAANFLIDTWNFATQPRLGPGLDLSILSVGNPVAIERFSYSNPRAAKYGHTTQTTGIIAPAIVGGVFSNSASLSIVPNHTIASAPLKIPSTAKVIEQVKANYIQTKYIWSRGQYKYEARWHTPTNPKYAAQGNTWVITRTIPGNAKGLRKVQHVLTGKYKWTPMKTWQDAILANKAGTATKAQKLLLRNGHHPSF